MEESYSSNSNSFASLLLSELEEISLSLFDGSRGKVSFGSIVDGSHIGNFLLKSWECSFLLLADESIKFLFVT